METVIHSILREQVQHHNTLLACFAGIEALSALMFAFPRTMKIGGWALTAILGFAFIFHGLQGDFNLELPVFAAGIVLVMAQRKNLHESNFSIKG